MELHEILEKSKAIRALYHRLERECHGSEWSLEEDTLAFLTDVGLIGRYTMSKAGRWPAEDTEKILRHKLSECIWWIAVLSDRMNINLEEALTEFLESTYKKLSTD